MAHLRVPEVTTPKLPNNAAARVSITRLPKDTPFRIGSDAAVCNWAFPNSTNDIQPAHIVVKFDGRSIFAWSAPGARGYVNSIAHALPEPDDTAGRRLEPGDRLIFSAESPYSVQYEVASEAGSTAREPTRFDPSRRTPPLPPPPLFQDLRQITVNTSVRKPPPLPPRPESSSARDVDTNVSAPHGREAAAFLAGAGQVGDDASISDPDALLRECGQMFAAMVAGLYSLMQSRKEIKQRLGLQETEFQDGHPLKFSPNEDVAVAKIIELARNSRLGETAIEDAFTDLIAHEAAMIHGMETALKAQLEFLKPETIEAFVAHKHKWRGGLPFIGRWLRWRRFKQLHRQAHDGFDGVFHQEIAMAFDKAYRHAVEVIRERRETSHSSEPRR